MKFSLSETDLDFVQSQLKRKPAPEELAFIESLSASVSVIREKAAALGSEANLLPGKTVRGGVEIAVGLEHPKSIFHSNRNTDLLLTGSKIVMETTSGAVKTAVGILDSEIKQIENPEFGSIRLFTVQGKRDIQAISKIGSDLPIVFTHPFYKAGLGFAIFELTRKFQCGFKITTKPSQISLKLHQNRSAGLILAVPEINVGILKRKLSAKKINTDLIGSLLIDKRIDVVLSKKNTMHLPLSVFGFLKSDYRDAAIVSFSATPQQQHYPALQKNYNSAAITIGKKKRNQKITVRPKKSMIGNSIAAVDLKSRKKYLYIKNKALTISKMDFHEQLPAGMAAQITREISSMGISPAGLTLAVGTKDADHPGLRKIFDSISYTCRMLKIPLQNRLVYAHSKKDFALQISIIGIGSHPDELIKRGIADPSNFILMLGSLKGELGNSEFLKLKGKAFSGNEPNVDLSAEFRLQEVLQLSAEGKLIQSAVSVGKGGLSAALIHSLRESPQEIGAKIFLNLKLRPDEILFGESQGVALVTVSERNLMDFERICMGQGIPSTTIGRVTDDGQFCFNDWIKLSRKNLH